MSFHVELARPYPTNKPTNGDVIPNYSEYPHVREYPNGQCIWISNPKPDKLDLMIPLVDEVLSESIAQMVPPHQRCKAISEFLTSGAANTCLVPNASWNKIEYYAREFQLELGACEAPLHCTLLGGTKYGPRLRISYNPSLFGFGGHSILFALLFGSKKLGAPPIFRKVAFAQWAKITRIDVAVDFIGLEVNEVVARHATAKGLTQLSAGEGTETVYLRNRKSGKAQVLIYNKRSQLESIGKIADDTPQVFTRIEVRRKGLHQKYLEAIFELPDPFEKLWCGYAYSQGAENYKRFQEYRAVRSSHSQIATQALLNLNIETVQELESLMGVPNADLVRPKDTWKGWKEASQATGVGILLP